MMEEPQCDDGGSDVELYDNVLDEDETPLIIDEGCLPSEDGQIKLTQEQEQRLLKLKSRKRAQESSKSYPCPDCGKVFRRKVKLQAHLATHKSKEELECENCDKKFRNVSLLFDHVCSGYGNSYKCCECNEGFRVKKDLTLHQLSHKKDGVSDISLDDPCEEQDFSSFVESFVKWPIACTHCGVELANIESYNAHMSAHKEGGPCVCLVCGMKFSCRDDFLLHKVVCRIEGIFVCTHCRKRFHTEKKLSVHLESHKVEKVCCDICGLRFVSKDKLASHMKTHKISTSIFVCGKCKKIFRFNSSFKSHTCILENNEKNFYTFADHPLTKVKEECQDSVSNDEESESEACQVLGECYSCQVCGDSFEQKKRLNTHMATHFQCIECKKYFKNQIDLDMHTFLLAEEKLYSCCLCENVVHGKKELELHLSKHLASSDVPLEDLDWEDNAQFLHDVIPNLNARETLQSTLLERSFPNVKIHKVVPAGNNALKCSSCGKLVPLHHSLSNIEPNTPVTDCDEEYVYISRLGNPQGKLRQSHKAYCTCHQNSSVLTNLPEQSLSKSLDEYECQEAHQLTSMPHRPVHLHPLKATLDKSVGLKSKSLLSELLEDSCEMELDVSNDESSNSDRLNDYEIFKAVTEEGYVSTSSLPVNTDSNKSPVLNMSDLVVTKKDGKVGSDKSETNLTYTDNVGDDKAVNVSKRSGIRVIRFPNTIDPAPSKPDTKPFVFTGGAGNENSPTKPVKILVSTGLFNPGINFGSVSELHGGSNTKKIFSNTKKIVSDTKRSRGELNVVNREDLFVPSFKRKDAGKNLQGKTVFASKKMKEEKSLKTVFRSRVTDATKMKVIATHITGNKPRAFNSKTLNMETKTPMINGENRIRVNRSIIDSDDGVSELMEDIPAINTKDLGKEESLVRKVNDEDDRPPKRSTPVMKKESENIKTRPDSSTPNVSENETCFIPEKNMVFKVEKLTYDSEEEQQQSLDFSGIKKEFLASDVFIKEEEWDIVDF